MNRMEWVIPAGHLAPMELGSPRVEPAVAKVVSIHAGLLLVPPETQQKLDELPRRVGRVFLMW
jgi:hypothetical protein